MKSLLVLFFGICVIMTPATAKLLPDYLKEQNFDIQKYEVSIDDNSLMLIKLVNDLFANARSQALKDIEYLETKINELADESMSNILNSYDSKLINAKKIVNAAMQKLRIAKHRKCSEKYLPKLQDVIIKGELEEQKNVISTAVKIADTKGAVQGFIDGIQQELLKINGVIPKCTKLLQLHEIYNCIVTEVNTVGINLLSKMPAAYKSLDDNVYVFHRYVSEINPYIKKSADAAEANAKAISAQIDDCLN